MKDNTKLSFPKRIGIWHRKSARSIGKLLVNTLLGFALLGILSALGVLAKLSLGLNLFNALVIAVLGVPGLALLILLRLVFI